MNKSELLLNEFEEVNYVDFYSDVFPSGSFQENGNKEDLKGNGLVVEIRDEKSRHHIITEDRKVIAEVIDLDFVITSPISYFGRNRTERNSTELFGMTFDLDGVSEKALGNLLHQIEHNQNPRPTYIVNSGHGLHLYYIFKEPIKLYNHIKEPLKKMKFELTERLWNIFTSDLKEKQFQGIFQGFRMVGSPSKFGKEYRLRAFKTGNKIDMDFMNSYVKPETQIHDLNYQPKLSLEEAKEKYPEWYNRKIVQGISERKTWNIKRDLYDWWKEKIIVEATFGHRYFCIMVLAIYAKKCNVSFEELEKDAYELMPILNEKHKDPFTEADVESALKSYEENYRMFPREDIEKITAIPMPANKRNGRTQEQHIQVMNAMKNVKRELGELKEGRPKGSGTKENKVVGHIKKNPDKTPTQIARELGISRPTVYKYLKQVREEKNDGK